MGRLRRARSIRWKAGDGEFAAQPTAPVFELTVHSAAGELALTPQRIIAILNPRWQAVQLPASRIDIVKSGEFGHDHSIDRYPVKDDVMQRHIQTVIVGSQSDDTGAKKRRLRQIEWTLRIGGRDLERGLFPLGFGPPRDVRKWHLYMELWVHNLVQLAVLHTEGCSPD